MLCNYYISYREFLHSISIHYAAHEIILHIMWLQYEVKNSAICYLIFVHMLCYFYHLLSTVHNTYLTPIWQLIYLYNMSVKKLM